MMMMMMMVMMMVMVIMPMFWYNHPPTPLSTPFQKSKSDVSPNIPPPQQQSRLPAFTIILIYKYKYKYHRIETLQNYYVTVLDHTIISVCQTHESESGQMVSEKVK